MRKFIVLLFVSLGLLYSQVKLDIHDKIDCDGKTDNEIINLLNIQIKKLSPTDYSVVESMQNQLRTDFENRKKSYLDQKTNLRTLLNTAMTTKKIKEDAVSNLIESYNNCNTKLETLKSEKNDQEIVIEMATAKIKEEKKRLKDELAKIPFYVLMIGKTSFSESENLTTVKNYITSAIVKEAISQSIGSEIVSKIVTQSDVLADSEIKIMIKGNAQTSLEYAQRFNNLDYTTYVYQFGKVMVYPFKENTDLHSNTLPNRKIDVEVIDLSKRNLILDLTTNNQKKIEDWTIEINRENVEFRNKINLITENVKANINKENKKIRDARDEISLKELNTKKFTEELNRYKYELEYAESEKQKAVSEYNNIYNEYNTWSNSETFVKTVPDRRKLDDDQTAQALYLSLIENTMTMFRNSIKTESQGNLTTVNGSSISEIQNNQVRKANIKSVKIIGKYVKNEDSETGQRSEYGVSVLYEYSYLTDKNAKIDFSSDFSTPQKLVNPKWGKLMVKVTPSDAKIFIDGIEKGTGSFSDSKILTGQYEIMAKLPMYEEQSQAISVKENQTSNVNLSLKRAYGSINISSIPAEADLYLDGNYLGKTPYRKDMIDFGVYDITLKKDNWEEMSDTILINDSTDFKQLYSLKKLNKISDKNFSNASHAIKSSQNKQSQSSFWTANKVLTTSVFFVSLGAGYYYKTKQDEYAKDYQNVTNIIEEDDIYKKWENSKNYSQISYSVSILPVTWFIYSWITHK